ncbi:hypothetical protein B5G21_06525 [Enorma massiliensis]|uniref:DUF3168 domain-containing protein n=1 Tax=Enorma massiliensis TaxID=1472761 RepID=A0A1Y3U8W8_9ACTN|nr:hypothetical protein B5G21_06525 [Enorma massiliensis]
MSCAESIAKLLADAHFTSCFTKVCPSALDCAEPIVVTEGAFSRGSRLAEEERGSVAVTVLVVREVAADAESVAVAAELAVRRADWEPYADAGGYRIVGIDTTAPAFKERDSSGRYVWAFDVACTVVRSL